MEYYEYEEELLKKVLNELDITNGDKQTEEKMADIMHRGIKRLEEKYSNVIDFEEEMEARELLFAYCRYGRSNAIEQFERDFQSDLVHLAIKGAVKANKKAAENEGTNESEV